MKNKNVLRFLSVLCLAVILIGCSGKKTTAVFTLTTIDDGYYQEHEMRYTAKEDKIVSMLQITTTYFAKSDVTREEFEAFDGVEIQNYNNNPVIKRAEIVKLDDEVAVQEYEIEYKKENYKGLMDIRMIETADGNPPKFISLEQTRIALLAQGYEEVTAGAK